MDLLDLLKQAGVSTLNKINENAQAGNDALDKQNVMFSKIAHNPNYQPTDQENQDALDYAKKAAGAVGGTIQPTNMLGGLLNKEAAAKEVSNNVYDLAQKAAKFGQSNGMDMNAVRAAQMAQSRAVDLADRLRQQTTAAKMAALKKYAGQ